MTNLEKLNEENRDMSLENLTDEQASVAIKFSPELTGGKIERDTYISNLVNNVDLNKVKEFITQADFDLLDERERLMNDYGFTEEEIEKGEAYLEKVRINPNMLDKDLENEGFPPYVLNPRPVIIVAYMLLNKESKSDASKEKEENQNDKGTETEGHDQSKKENEDE